MFGARFKHVAPTMSRRGDKGHVRTVSASQHLVGCTPGAALRGRHDVQGRSAEWDPAGRADPPQGPVHQAPPQPRDNLIPLDVPA